MKSETTPLEAIGFALTLEDFVREFLQAWTEGDTSEWEPDLTEWRLNNVKD